MQGSSGPYFSDTFPPSSPRQIDAILRGFQNWGGLKRFCFIAVVLLFEPTILRPSHCNPLVGPILGPLDLSALDPVMGATRQTPVPDGWAEADGDAVKSDLPISRAKGCDYFMPAAAAAFVNCCAIWKRDVQDALLWILRN